MADTQVQEQPTSSGNQEQPAAKKETADRTEDEKHESETPDDRNEDEKLESWKIPSSDERWEKIAEDGGLLKWVVSKGADASKPPYGCKVKCHYTGMLTENGKKFDSSKDRGNLFSFDLGQGKVIKGWDEGIATMTLGERAVLRCRSDYAYGEQGSPPNIPGGASLDFVVELKEFNDFDDVYGTDDCISKKEITKGDYSNVREQASVTVQFTGRVGKPDGEIFQEEKEAVVKVPYDEEFEGQGTANEYPYCRGFYKCLKDLSSIKGRTIYKIIPDDRWSYNAAKCNELKIPEGTPIFYEIEASAIENPPASWEMKDEEKPEAAKKLKASANEFFKKKKMKLAKRLYKEALDLLTDDNMKDDELKALKVSLLSNQALIQIREGEWNDALSSASDGLKLDPDNIKLLYRRAQCKNESADWDECVADLKLLLQKDEKNAPAQRLLKTVKKKNKEYMRKKRSMASAFFST